jgi:exonuclease VII small subunit
MDPNELSLLGEKLSLMKILNHCQEQLNKVNHKLEKIKKRQVFKILKGKKK